MLYADLNLLEIELFQRLIVYNQMTALIHF